MDPQLVLSKLFVDDDDEEDVDFILTLPIDRGRYPRNSSLKGLDQQELEEPVQMDGPLPLLSGSQCPSEIVRI